MFALLALCSGGCASPRLYYETTGHFHDAVEEGHRGAMVREIEDALGHSRRILLVGKDGRQRQVHPKPQGGAPALGRLDLSLPRAVHIVTDDDYLGAEADLRIAVKGRGRKAVTVWVDLDGQVQVRAGRLAKRRGGAPTPASLSARYGIGRLNERGARWSTDGRHALALALSKLSPREVAVLRGIPFVRTPVPRQGSATGEGARYIQHNDSALIEVYHRAFELGKVQFVGGTGAGLPTAVRTLLHEIGHAIHQHPGRGGAKRHANAVARYNRLVKTNKATVARYNATARKLNAGGRSRSRLKKDLARLKKQLDAERARLVTLGADVDATRALAEDSNARGPVLDAYARALGDGEAPTRYGEESQAESFAESFSLYAADPAALKRVLPGVHAWFARGGHMDAAIGPGA